jgi:hypothetical protein
LAELRLLWLLHLLLLVAQERSTSEASCLLSVATKERALWFLSKRGSEYAALLLRLLLLLLLRLPECTSAK